MSTRIYAKCDGSTSFRDRRDVQSSSSAFAVRTIHPKTMMMSEKKKREEKLSLSRRRGIPKGGHARMNRARACPRDRFERKKSRRAMPKAYFPFDSSLRAKIDSPVTFHPRVFRTRGYGCD